MKKFCGRCGYQIIKCNQCQSVFSGDKVFGYERFDFEGTRETVHLCSTECLIEYLGDNGGSWEDIRSE